MELDLDLTTAEGRYGMMLAVRETEERIGSMFLQGRTCGTAHLCVGQEACAVGAVAAARPTDPLVSSHRGHGHFLARVQNPHAMLAELMGKATGPCMGRGGSQHLCSLAHDFYGTNGITGGGLPIATGLALSEKLRGTDRVVIVFFGDGASNQGTFHESLNMAAIWQLPVLYFCENNQYAMSMSVHDSMHVNGVADRAVAYGMPGLQVDGMDVDAVRAATEQALATIRAGGGPVLLEAECYRFSGHSKSDRFVYRTREEEAAWEKRDPLKTSRRALLAGGVGENAVLAIEQGVRDVVAEAAEQAERDPEPTPDQVLVSPYAGGPAR
jgi:TPP-dependent pyruvate/acetoin dehydrogenase alpha subunit